MKIISSQAAAGLLQDGWTVSTSGFTGVGHPENISRYIEERFLSTGHPRNLTYLYAAGQGNREGKGSGRFAHEGLVARVIGGHWGAAGPRMAELVYGNKIEAWNFPQGVITHLFRAIAGGKPGVITRIGLHTFVDPRHDGGRLNERTKDALIDLITLRGQEHLFFPSMPIHCAMIRATSADPQGNLSCEDEAFHGDVLALAQAAHNSGGIVIAQVKRLVGAHEIALHAVRVPGILVDYVCVCDQEQDHWQTYIEPYNPAYCGASIEPASQFVPEPLSIRKIIQRRAYLELRKHAGAVVNLGVGIPAGIGKIAREQGYSDFTMTVESGPIGGTPAELRSFGAATNPQCIVSHAEQFDFYDGGGLDLTFLGLAEFDPQGNVNVSRFGKKVAGVGGFINITQTARNIVFMGTLTTDGLEVRAEDGRLHIVQEGRIRKLLPKVNHLSFNGPYTSELGIPTLYITERAVFELRQGVLTLTEIAPGVDLQKDVLDQIEAPVAVAVRLARMPADIFRDRPMEELTPT
jgi:propionate CoA-transferase